MVLQRIRAPTVILGGAHLRGHMSVNLLKSNVAAWNDAWRNGDLGRAEMDGFDLAGEDLEGAILSTAQMKGANLQGVNLDSARLHCAKLQGAILKDASLNGAELNHANLLGAQLSGAQLNRANLNSAQLPGTDLRRTGWFRSNLSGANLREANLAGAHMNQVNLNGANLDGANLSGANLSNAKLRCSTLKGANLNGATLDASNLHGANLEGANLTGADLRSANLSGANIEGAILSESKVMSCNLAGAQVGWTLFCAMDLRGALGLESVNHRGPSTVGIDTFEYSEGQIPNAFLRGCGVSELLVEFARDVVAPFNVAYYSAFLSHSSDDKLLVRRFYEKLHSQLRIPCWLDERQMVPGDDLRRSITEGIRSTDKMILFCSKKSLASWWVDDEVRKVIRKEQAFHENGQPHIKLIVPVDLDGALFDEGIATHPWVDLLRERIVQSVDDWTDEQQFQDAAGKVANALRTTPIKPLLPQPKLDPNQ